MVTSSVLTALDTAETSITSLGPMPRPTNDPSVREAAETALMVVHSIREDGERALTLSAR